MKRFDCTHPGHEGDRDTEGVPFGPYGQEWCQACYWFDTFPDGTEADEVRIVVRHLCGHHVGYRVDARCAEEDCERLGWRKCPACRIAEQNRLARAAS